MKKYTKLVVFNRPNKLYNPIIAGVREDGTCLASSEASRIGVNDIGLKPGIYMPHLQNSLVVRKEV